MLGFFDNLYNLRQGPDEPKLKLWRYAGLLLTYRCTAACRFCYYRCGPSAGGLMTVQTAIESWQGLERITGNQSRVHLTGGEPFLYFDRLAEICVEARRQGLKGPESVETNAGWAAGESDRSIQDKLRLLNDCSMERLKISWDPFHEEFVDVEQVRRLVEIAGRVLGPQRVLVRWQKYLEHPTGIRNMPEEDRFLVLKDALKADKCRFTGRAAESLAELEEGAAAEAFDGQDCRRTLLDAKGIHVDPEGNVFLGQCSGMMLGNVRQTPVDRLWQSFEPNKMEFWSVLFNCGPVGFLSSAVEQGYHVGRRYASKCHLCTELRGFFFDKKRYSSIIGPNKFYQDGI
ncbi:MAG: hypothetical protein LLF76_06400 [Planctomycetaceae bacterium]|nr:hypothetical protein [Planctomycetaceae bacterium]